jgi:NAD(P)-dependent dehydrogenase (short-subunit alcohol dehydrogenase family)
MILSGKRITVLSGSSGMGLASAPAAARDEANVVIASSSKDRIDALATLPTGTEGHVLDLPTAMQSRRLSPGFLTAWSRSDEQ